MVALFQTLSQWPLALLHGLGWMLGWVAYAASPSYRARLQENAAQAGISNRARRQSVAAAGQMVAELPRLWLGAPVPVRWTGQALVEQALQDGRGVVFLTPHLGCFEIAAQAYAARYGVHGHPITVLFRPPRKAWLQSVIGRSRQRPGLHTAPTTLAGVKQLIKALKNGQCVGLLPDQVPGAGQGVWAPFFGRDAYTMKLSVRLARQTGAAVVLAWGERLPWGRGYVVHVEPLNAPLDDDLTAAVQQINAAMEGLIRQSAGQYLWGYARYKAPRDDAAGGGI